MKEGDSLLRLRELTERLPPFPPMQGQVGGDCRRYDVSCGTSLSWDLLNIPEVTCCRWFNSAGTIFQEHAHSEREWLIVYEGSMLIRISDCEEEQILPGQFAVIEPRVVHSARFLEDCWYLAITIPQTQWKEPE